MLYVFKSVIHNGRSCRTILFCDWETGELYSDLMEIKILELKKLRKDVPEHGDGCLEDTGSR